MKGSFILFYLLLTTVGAQAQQLPLFTQYRDYLSVINPGAVPSDFLMYDYPTSVGLSYRRQYAGLSSDDGIHTTIVRLDHVNTDKKLLVSGYLLGDKAGPSGTVGAYGRLGYLLSYDPREWALGIGLSAGMAHYRINTSEITWTDLGDPLANQDLKKTYPDFGAGAFFYKSMSGGWEGDRWYVGVSVPQMFGLDLKALDRQDNTYRLTRIAHFYGNLGLIKYLNENTFLEFTSWVKYIPEAPLNMDFNFRSQFGQVLFLGAGYGTSENLHVEAGVLLSELIGRGSKIMRLGYSFDRHFTRIGPTFGPAHEINFVVANSGYRRRN